MKNHLKLFSSTSAKDNFYIGQVNDVISPSSVVIKFLTPAKGRNDYFRWPFSDDIAQVESTFVYRWDFDVMSILNDGRIWNVPDIFTTVEAYKKKNLTANH